MATHIGSFTIPAINQAAVSAIHSDPKSDEAKAFAKAENGKAQFPIDDVWYVAFKWDAFRQVRTIYGKRQGKGKDLPEDAECPHTVAVVHCQPMEDGSIHYAVAAQPRN